MNLRLSSIVALAISLAGVSFAAPISPSELRSNASQGLRLIELAEGAEPVWMTEDQKLDLIRARTRFVLVALYSFPSLSDHELV